MSSWLRVWFAIWKLAIAAGFVGLGLFGVGLMAAVVWYPTTLFWGIVVFLLGLLGFLLAIGAGMTAINRPTGDGWSSRA